MPAKCVKHAVFGVQSEKSEESVYTDMSVASVTNMRYVRKAHSCKDWVFNAQGGWCTEHGA